MVCISKISKETISSRYGREIIESLHFHDGIIDVFFLSPVTLRSNETRGNKEEAAARFVGSVPFAFRLPRTIQNNGGARVSRREIDARVTTRANKRD